jgi:sugar/nucleoside kinase (ribokinase family)
MARLMALKPLVSVNRQEAAIAAEAHGFSPEVSAFGAAWLKKYAAPLIVRLDKEGACYFSPQESGLAAPFPTTVVDTIGAGDSHAGGTLAGLAAGWSLGRRLRWGMPLRPGSWAIGAAIAPRTAKRYSSHTKTYRSLRQ